MAQICVSRSSPDMEKGIRSVLGILEPEDMGRTDAHNHIWIADQGLPEGFNFVLDNEELILEELNEYKNAGGSSQVDCQPGGAGRDGNKLRSLSGKTGVHIVACTGFHLNDYYPAGYKLWSYTSDQAADYFLDEIQNGMLETKISDQTVYPGFIKIAVRDDIKSSPLNLMEGAVAASLESGYLIEMHTEKGAGAEDFLNYFTDKGLPPEQLVICHIDKRPDLALHMELAREGCLLEYDTFFRPKYNPEKNVWYLVREMVGAGFGGSIACATDLADSSQWHSYGGDPGLAGFVTDIEGQLVNDQFDQEIINGILGKNIADRLVVEIKENSS